MSSAPAPAPASLPAPAAGEGTLAAGTFRAVAILSGVAAGIHLGVAPQHFAEWWGYGAFFVLAAVGECALIALLALRPRAWVVQAGIWASLATMLMYLVSRTSGIPLGPQAGVVEPVELQGLAATAAEGALVVVLCGLLAGRERRVHAERARPRRRSPVDRRADRRTRAACTARRKCPCRPRRSHRARRDARGRAVHPGQCAQRTAAAR